MAMLNNQMVYPHLTWRFTSSAMQKNLPAALTSHEVPSCDVYGEYLHDDVFF